MFFKLSELSAANARRDPIPILKDLIAAGPVVESKIPILGKFRLATTYSAVDQVLRDRNRFVLQANNAGVGRRGDFIAWMPRPIRVLANNMLQKDEPDHRRLRGLSEIAFRRKNVNAMRDDIGELCDGLIGTLDQTQAVDFIDSFSRRLPLEVICDLLGLPQQDQPKFIKWMNGLTNASIPLGIVTAIPGIVKMNRYLRARFAAERLDPVGGLISELVAAEEDGDKLSEEELLAMTFILFVAGHETTTHLITLSLLTLLQRPALREQWVQEPATRPSAVDELLRYLSPVQFTKPRYVAEDTELDGVPMHRGERIFALLAAANMDEAQFTDPAKIDFARQPNRHKGFGGGIHFCLGFQLAKLEVEIALTRIFETFPNISLAAPEHELRWTTRPGIRSLKKLPVHLNG